MANRLRQSEFVPPMHPEDARRLRGLPPTWEQTIAESSIDGLKKRAGVLVCELRRRGRRRRADDLQRRVSLLERADELHRHAADIEALAGLYRALALFAHERDPARDGTPVWAQIGGLDEGETCTACHGPAFRETVALRNRAFRWVAAALAQELRELGTAR